MTEKKDGHGSKQDRLQMLQDAFQAVHGQEDLFSNIIEFFPYPIEVFARDGITVMVNRAALAELEIPDRDMVVGKYNIFKDPEIAESGLADLAREVFGGRTITVTDIKGETPSYVQLRESPLRSRFKRISAPACSAAKALSCSVLWATGWPSSMQAGPLSRKNFRPGRCSSWIRAAWWP